SFVAVKGIEPAPGIGKPANGHQFPYRQFQAQSIGLFQDGQPLGQGPAPVVRNVPVIDDYGAPVRVDDPGNDSQKGALPRCIAPDQGNEFPLGQLQADPVHDQGIVILFADVLYGYHTRFTLNNRYIKYRPPTKLMMMLTVELKLKTFSTTNCAVRMAMMQTRQQAGIRMLCL